LDSAPLIYLCGGASFFLTNDACLPLYRVGSIGVGRLRAVILGESVAEIDLLLSITKLSQG
jgi:hypothetical protein